MQTKQKLKYKRKLPKANFGLDPRSLDNMNKAGVNPEEESGGTMDAAGKGMGIASSVLQGVSSFMPQDNMDGIGVSHKGSSISKGVSGGLKTGASIAKAVPGVGTIVGGVMDAGAAITDMVTGWVDKIREKDPTKVSRLARKEYEDSYSNVGYSFGTPAAKNGMVLNPTPQPKNKLDFDMERPLPSDLAYERNIGYSQDGKNYIKGEPQFKNGGDPKKTIENLSYEDILTLNSLANKENLSKSKAATSVYKQNGLDEYINSFDDYLKAYSKSKLGSVYDEYKNVGKDTLGNYITDEVKAFSPNFIDRLQQNVNQSKRYLPQPIIKKGGQIEEFKNGGKPQPIYTSDKNDPRLRAYNDSLSLYKEVEKNNMIWKNYNPTIDLFKNNKAAYSFHKKSGFPNKNIEPIGLYNSEGYPYAYKKPVQPVIYQEREQPRNIEKLEAVGTTKMSTNKPEISLNKKETSSGNYTVNTQDNSYSIPNKALFDIIVKKGRANNSWESNGSGGATFDMSDETFFNNIGEYKKTFELGGDPRHLADVEAEKGEALQRGNKIIPIGGNTHQNGGTPLKVQPDDKYIYSDTLGLDSDGKISINPKTVSQTFATLAKRTETKYKGKSDDLSLKTKDLELKMLTAKAEEARVLKEQTDEMKMTKKYKAKYGADLKKFNNSGFVFNQKDYIDWIKQTPEYQNTSKGDKLYDLNSNESKSVYRPMYAEAMYNTHGADAYNTIQNEFSKRPGGFNPGIDKGDKTTYNSLPGYSFTTNSQGLGAGKAGDYGALFDPNPSGGNIVNPFIGPRKSRDDLREDSLFYTPGQIGTPITQAQGNTTDEDILNKTQNGLFQNLSQGDKIQLAGMLPAVGYNLAMGLRKSEVEQAKKNPYESNILNMMANRKFDMQPYLNEANLANNVAREDIGNNASSVGGKMANLQKLHANNLNALQSLTAKEQEVNNNYRAEEANVKNTLGENARREEIRISDINAQNRATKQNFLGKATQQIGQGINTLGRGANQSLTNQMQIKAMSELSPDYDIRPLRELYRSGQVDQNGLIEFNGNKYIYDPKRDVATYVGPSSTAPAAPTDGTKSPYSPIPFNLKNFTNSGKTKKTN